MIETNGFWHNRRVLITGHTGFKGSWLCVALGQLGADIYGIGLEPQQSRQNYPALFESLGLQESMGSNRSLLLDINDTDQLEAAINEIQPDIVFHLAAQPLVRLSYKDPATTWQSNVMGTLNLLERLRQINHRCAVVIISTDKVYANQGWDWGYRESDQLGGHDPYSASKAAMELLVDSWRQSFCGPADHQTPHLLIATARAGNVIGGGDWAEDRIIPDAIDCLSNSKAILARNPKATRPWQHVLEPLCGYQMLAEKLYTTGEHYSSAFNFGPHIDSNRSVEELLDEVVKHWPGTWQQTQPRNAPHEAQRLHLQIDKAHHSLGWKPRWDFETAVKRTIDWYQNVEQGAEPLKCCINDINAYANPKAYK